MIRKTTLRIITGLAILSLWSVCWGQDAPRVGVEERLGSIIPLEELSFTDEEGKSIALKELFDRPVALTLVYYRCPGICTPLLQEKAWVADNCDLAPGQDYRMITISFDPKETADLAKTKKANMLDLIKAKQIPTDGWRFLTGDEKNIRKITEAVGFYYMPDRNKVDFVHGATIIFLSGEGKIVRYLIGTRFNPVDVKMAVLDASEGRARSFMQKMQQLCYTYDPEARTYVLQINRLILAATLLFVAVFVWYLLRKKPVVGPVDEQIPRSES
ncbi:MAG: SCO family protein [Planctomycetota bacterium]|jgi:protein SCO1/2